MVVLYCKYNEKSFKIDYGTCQTVKELEKIVKTFLNTQYSIHSEVFDFCSFKNARQSFYHNLTMDELIGSIPNTENDPLIVELLRNVIDAESKV